MVAKILLSLLLMPAMGFAYEPQFAIPDLAVDQNFKNVAAEIKDTKSTLATAAQLASTQTFSGTNTFIGITSGPGMFAPGDFKWKISSSSACGSGWIRADGSSLSTTTYSALFAEIGYMFGGTGANFTLPDMNNGEFIRAVSTATTSGWARTSGFGAKQEDAFQGHYHRLGTEVNHRYSNYAVDYDAGAGSGSAATHSAVEPITDGSNGTPRTAIETRPRNYAMLPCIYTGVK